MNITKKNSPNKYNGRNGWKPDMIVCHITEGSYNGAVSWLCNPVITSYSIHYTKLYDVFTISAGIVIMKELSLI